MRASVILAAAAALVACASAVTGPVTEFPPLSLYCGSGDYTASNTDNLGSAAVFGNLNVVNYGIGQGLKPAPVGKSPPGRLCVETWLL